MCVCLWVLAGAGGRELVAGCLLDCLLDCLLLCLLDGMRAAYEDACSRLLLCLLDACLMLAWCFAGRRITLSGSQLASIGIVLGNGGHTRARASPSNEWRADAAPIAHIHTRARTHTLYTDIRPKEPLVFPRLGSVAAQSAHAPNRHSR